MAERPGFRPRPSAPMQSPALDEGADGRREGIRRELWDRLTNGGQNTAPARSFVGNRENPDQMPVRMSPWQQGMTQGAGPEPPPEGLDGSGGPGGRTQEIAALIQQVAADAPDEFKDETLAICQTLAREQWPMTGKEVTEVVENLKNGLSRETILRQFRLSHGG